MKFHEYLYIFEEVIVEKVKCQDFRNFLFGLLLFAIGCRTFASFLMMIRSAESSLRYEKSKKYVLRSSNSRKRNVHSLFTV